VLSISAGAQQVEPRLRGNQPRTWRRFFGQTRQYTARHLYKPAILTNCARIGS